MLDTGDQISPEDEPTEYLDEEYQADIMTSNEPTYPQSVLASRSRFCRCCLKRSESFLLPLVAKIEHITVMEMLLMVTGVELEANPLFPTKICTNCMTKLDFAYNVRQEFLNSSELLLKMAVEDKLAGYYAQFECNSAWEGVAGTYTDEILKDSRTVLETKMDLNVKVNFCKKEEVSEVEELEEAIEQFEEKIDLGEVEMVEFEQLECLEDELDGSTVDDRSKDVSELTKEKTEKFVYSWKELVKPKRTKKERPKNALSGINRKAKADAELLAQFPQTTCYICDTAHQTLEERDEHLNVHISMVPHRCVTCSTDDESVISKSVITLNRHRLMHRLPYKCTMCFRRFISSGSQYTHIWSMHMADTEGLTCDYCGKSFNQKRSFQAHVRRHRYKANGKYRCDICEETCGSSLLLTRHKRKHTGEKNFSCPYCPKRFSRACNLLTHKRIHTNERCHRCEDCGRSFRDSVTLRKHQERFHMGRTPVLKVDRNPFIITQDGRKMFQCKNEGCKYETYSSTSISRHKARHLKRYACGDCGKRFAEPNLVRRHQASMHSGKNKKDGQIEEEPKTGASEHQVQPEGDVMEMEEYVEDDGQTELEYKIEVVDDIEAGHLNAI